MPNTINKKIKKINTIYGPVFVSTVGLTVKNWRSRRIKPVYRNKNKNLIKMYIVSQTLEWEEDTKQSKESFYICFSEQNDEDKYKKDNYEKELIEFLNQFKRTSPDAYYNLEQKFANEPICPGYFKYLVDPYEYHSAMVTIRTVDDFREIIEAANIRCLSDPKSSLKGYGTINVEDASRKFFETNYKTFAIIKKGSFSLIPLAEILYLKVTDLPKSLKDEINSVRSFWNVKNVPFSSYEDEVILEYQIALLVLIQELDKQGIDVSIPKLIKSLSEY